MNTLLQQILERLDAELDRLHSLREIVDDLGHTPSLLEELTPELRIVSRMEPERESEIRPEPDPKAERQPKPRVVRAAARPATAVSKKVEKQITPTALTSAVPAGPVLISAQALERERQAAAKVPAPGSPPTRTQTPDSVVRDLTARWLSGSAARPA